MATQTKDSWVDYCTSELDRLRPILAERGFALEAEQPHLKGERFLMQAATTSGGVKLILFGRDTTGTRVVIKATRDLAGQAELRHERTCREVLHQLKFAAEVFHTPPEVAWIETAGFVVSVQEFIDQVTTFLERPLPEQFSLALSAFKAQEGTHATTFSHRRLIAGVYDERNSETYLRQFAQFTIDTTTNLPEATDVAALLAQTQKTLEAERVRLEQYTGFLTHTDFVPHNIRIDANGTMYLLDHSSLTFGNKHESWARFVNFMTLYNPPLAAALTQYVADNRSNEEQESLWLMRLYRLGELIWYYQNKLPFSEGNLHTLNHTRVFFWADVLRHVLAQEAVPPSIITEYQKTRDALRSADEKERQRGLH